MAPVGRFSPWLLLLPMRALGEVGT